MKAINLIINNKTFSALLTESQYEQERGLMFHKDWPPPIMVWSYEAPRINNFWMKNTYCPLDIVFCLNGKIQKICEGTPHSTNMIGGILSDCVIELPYGTSQVFNFNENTQIKILK